MERPTNSRTLLQRRKQTVKISKNEILLILRSYREHPTKWTNILESVKENIDHLPEDAKMLYRNGTFKQLRDRMSGKLGKLMSANQIEDEEIRAAVQSIKDSETRTISRPRRPLQEVQNEVQDERDDIASNINNTSEDETDADIPPPSRQPDEQPGPSHIRSKKRPLTDIIRENHLSYNNFIKKKIPKLLRQLDVSSDSDSNSDI